MPKTIIAEGKTTTEAISNGLKELNVSKDMVNVKIIEEHEKRSFFSILAPRVVKVELTLKENREEKPYKEKEHIQLSEEELNSGKIKIEKFLNQFISNFESLEYSAYINLKDSLIKVEINGDSSKKLIGYRGEILNSLQNILSAVANRNSNKRIRVILDISKYREKREKALEELADKVSKTVIRTGKSITLEPMMAYERKIIHNRLQSNNKVSTHSVGEEPYRKVVISKNK